ncbi:MAG: YlqD family protein [Candidatus Sericytochromatia bacterium]
MSSLNSISVKRQVLVQAIVTEVFKTNAANEIQQNLQQMDSNLQQLEFQGKRALADLEKQKASPAELENVKGQIEAERQRLNAGKQELLQKLNMIGQLELGTLFPQGTIDNYVELKVGDNLYEKMSNAIIVVKDGVVTEIRG